MRGTSTRRRVAALPPDERRARLIEATLPLLRRYGPGISTRQIAEAAGVAEGTIFGAFRDKSTLLRAAVEAAFDPDPVVRALRAIDAGADLRARLVAAARILMERVSDNASLVAVCRTLAATENAGDLMQRLSQARTRMLDAIATLVEPDRAALRRSPATVARQLFLWTVFATRHGALTEDEPMDADEIVALLLDGVLSRTGTGDT
ncbi:MAG: TetR/AcrR family transcriptional regulator [Micromonosporaceae bacterium]|nr:TetR/AcrR family transcriptional regulator [Micromonosporaceae bacterium]